MAKVPITIPGEVWFLACDNEPGAFIPPGCDDFHGGEVYLAYTSEEEALLAVAFHLDKFGIACHPVRVK